MRKPWDAVRFRSLEDADFRYAAQLEFTLHRAADLEKNRLVERGSLSFSPSLVRMEFAGDHVGYRDLRGFGADELLDRLSDRFGIDLQIDR